MVDHTDVLSLTTLIGLIVGVLAAKQRRLPRLFVHALAIGFGLLLAFWQTAGADYNGNVTAFSHSIHQWITLALAGGTSSDDSIFLFFITALGFLLAYTSAWLVYHTRKPWMMILSNGVVIFISCLYFLSCFDHISVWIAVACYCRVRWFDPVLVHLK